MNLLLQLNQGKIYSNSKILNSLFNILGDWVFKCDFQSFKDLENGLLQLFKKGLPELSSLIIQIFCVLIKKQKISAIQVPLYNDIFN